MISLIGYRGVGKTTVARQVAERLGWSWKDADQVLQEMAGETIASIFQNHGEPVFRDWESQVVRTLAPQAELVVAWGGGVILREENRQALRANSRVVWLQAELETLYQRIYEDDATAAQRPSLTKMDPREEIAQLLRQRTPLYRECADWELSTEGRSPEELAEQIVAWRAL